MDNMSVAASKADLYDNKELYADRFDVWVSAKTGFAMDKLEGLIKERLKVNFTENTIDLITDRQYEEVMQAIIEFESALSSSTTDIAAFYLTRGLNRLKRIGGEDVSEAVLDVVFSKFCIGK
jgi:tRNA modification GTPase